MYIKPNAGCDQILAGNDKGGLEEDVKAIDSAITFIACEHDAPGVLSEKNHCRLLRL